jgi:undecaprenyl-diphosphatase
MNGLIVLDQNITEGLINFTLNNPSVLYWTKLIAQYLIYAIPIFLLLIWFWPKTFSFEKVKPDTTRKNSLKAVIIALISWQVIARIIGHLINRPRPVQAILEGKEILFHRPTYSFPSDHSTFIFTLAFCFLFSENKKIGWIFMILGVIISISRVMAGVHFTGDVLAGFLLGLIVALSFQFLKIIIEPIVNIIFVLMKKVGLA